ncbi:MAG: uracil-DNA glycosylase [Burkholderiaceae bacterium]|nr:uracil-DNA glycosylase [Aquabacterium sp.]NUP84251.1 uracil-DNA glycosylase [Burkholderiaceae bacterium]
MRWTERQQRQLHAMGVRPWGPEVRTPIALASADAGELPPAVLQPPVAPGAAAVAPVIARSVAAERQVEPSSRVESGAGIASMGWAELAQAVAHCRQCGLAGTRNQPVFGVGNPQAHWMIVGEAPGEQEDLRGEPFVGAAGQLLDQMLAALGLSREAGPPQRQVYIANTLKCRPPRNRNPEPAELQQCQPYLLRQVELVQPRVVLAMGRFAVQSLLESTEPIGRLRGRVHRWRGRPLVVTYHPAYLLRNPADKARAWTDLCLAAHALRSADA